MSQVRVKDGKRTVSFYTALSSEEVELAVQQYAGMKTFKKRPRSTPADESDFVPSAPRGLDGVEEMLAEFVQDFAIEQADEQVTDPRAGISPNTSMDDVKPANQITAELPKDVDYTDMLNDIASEQKQKRGKKELEPVSLREYDRHNYRLK
jgi:hypothetical protein